MGHFVVLHPPSTVTAAGVGFLPLTLGDFVFVGRDSVVRAASIGTCVHIGASVVLGERCIIKDCCEILDGSVVPPDTVIPPFTRWGGNPCRMLGVLNESYAKTREWDAEETFSKIAPL